MLGQVWVPLQQHAHAKFPDADLLQRNVCTNGQRAV